jgi:hypothetical protein
VNALEERLATAGDDYYNWYELLAQVDELRRIGQMLDERAGWTVLTESCIASTPSERVAAVLSVLELRSEIKEWQEVEHG